MASFEITKLRTKMSLSAFLVVCISLLAACGGDHSQIALKVARDWSSNQVQNVSSELGKAVVGDQQFLAGLAGSVIDDQIQENMKWNFSTPVETSDDRYRVVATARSLLHISIPLISDKNYDIAVDFILDIDTSNERVTNSTLDVSSLRIIEQ